MTIFDTPPEDPFGLFESWMADAVRSEVNDPNAMALATADKDTLPNVRMVLLKGVDARGFVFYTNLESQKGVSFKPPSGGFVFSLEEPATSGARAWAGECRG